MAKKTVKPIAEDSMPHDTGYKLLFSHPRLVQDLITGFVQPEWLDSIDFKTLEPVKASFATDDLRQRHDDCIWRMKFKDTWLYLYLLLEFQSSDDYFMANRVMTYLGLLYQDIIRSQLLKKGDLLPPVLPIVIYNGASNWSGPVEIASLINPIHPALQAYTPQLSYFLLQERATPKDYSQTHPTNLVGHLIALEQCATSDDLQNQLQLLQQQLKAARYQPIRRSFAIWLSRLLRVKFKTESIPEYQELNEVNAMLAERLTDWTLQWKKEGEEIGEKRGEKRGEKIGQKKEALRLLIRLSQLKYGELPDWAVQNMEQADLQQLENWAERILTAESLEALMT
ncbi:MAG: Rpn family recombination-promoting nuclease/putative transposase [Methylicorpusculum sp.]|uniref:Rpn family recombination-promoting nuclease/putative transposase n=1 Tax=Methylicorpusculum sp. TaxID=2713644 RepID=UPI0027217473|nr:Rpn family recombination-promoting nuclease/putative transposase [Methylicorpusculum sp.]MDO8938601.1 Rpn family recombination-promoting nuclease/putative transposase [Methylicorpusculum sp.]